MWWLALSLALILRVSARCSLLVAGSLIIALLIVASVLGLTMVLVYLYYMMKADKEEYKGWIANSRIALSFVQSMSLVSALAVVKDAAPAIPFMMSVFEVLFLDIGASRPECLLPQGFEAGGLPLPYLSLGVSVITPVAGMGLLTLVGTCCARFGNEEGCIGSNAIYGYCVNIFSWFFSSLTQLVLHLVMLDAPAFRAMGITLLIFEVLGVIKLVVDYKLSADSSQLDARLKHITWPFKDDCNYWQFVIWFFLFLRAVMVVTISQPIAAGLSVFFVNLAFLALLLCVMPYEDARQNYIDGLLQIVMKLIVGVSSIFYAATGGYNFSAMSNATEYDASAIHQIREDYKHDAIDPSVRTTVDVILSLTLALPVVSILGAMCYFCGAVDQAKKRLVEIELKVTR